MRIPSGSQMDKRKVDLNIECSLFTETMQIYDIHRESIGLDCIELICEHLYLV
jgi:hypothetical protein